MCTLIYQSAPAEAPMTVFVRSGAENPKEKAHRAF